MKVTQEKPAFTPVTIILETQSEVDALYLVSRHNGIDNAVKRAIQSNGMNSLFNALGPFASSQAKSNSAFDLFEKNLPKK